MLTDFHSFYEFIEPRVPDGIPGPSMERAIRETAIEIYKDSGWLTEYTLAPLNLKANVAVYELQTQEPDTAICDLSRVLCNNIPVSKKERSYLDQFEPLWETQTSASPNFYIPLGYDDARYQIQLVPFPNADTSATNTTALTIRAIMCPTSIAQRLDGSAWTRMRRAIAAGVLTDLLSQNGMPWFNEEQAAHYDAEFQRLKGRLMIQREIGDGKQVATITTARFGVYPRQY